MSDLIDRQAAIDEADEWLDAYADDMREDVRLGIKHVKRSLKKLPSVQPDHIIRCRDCKFWQDSEDGVVEVPICARPQNKFEKHPMVMMIGGDGFCSFAERREDG